MSVNVCPGCGAPLEKGARTCAQCGAKLAGLGELSPSYVDGTKYEPVGTWNFVLSQVLAAIPVVNIVLLVIWSLGGSRKINKRNWARAQLICLVIFLLLAGILVFVGSRFTAVKFSDVADAVRSVTG